MIDEHDIAGRAKSGLALRFAVTHETVMPTRSTTPTIRVSFFIACICAGLLLLPSLSFAANTIGSLDAIDQNGLISGWAYDPASPSKSINVSIYLDAPAGAGPNIANGVANLPRPDVDTALSIQGNHGYSIQIPSRYLDGAIHTLYVYGVATSASLVSAQVQHSPKGYLLGTHNPTGSLDGIDSAGIASGWALDPDAPSQNITVDFYIDRPAVNGGGTYSGSAVANVSRPDVDQATGYTGRYGFGFTIPAQYFDGQQHTLYAYAVNATGTPGINVQLPGSPKTFTLARRTMPTLGNATIGANGISVQTTARLAGAIGSLTWNGMQFVDDTDHGREIQTAWFGNGWGACFNPTEAGSQDDGAGPFTTSQLLSMSTTPNSLTTVSHPAFWLTPGGSDPNCNFDASNPGLWDGGAVVNTSPRTEATFRKTVTIGVGGIPNAIEYDAQITLTAHELSEHPLSYFIFDFASYMPLNFTTLYKENSDGTWTSGQSLAAVGNSFSSYPVILTTADGNYAEGLYSPDVSLLGYPQNPQKNHLGYAVYDWGPVNSINVAIPGTPAGASVSGGTYSYKEFLAIGTLSSVETALHTLRQMYPPAGADR